MSKNDDRRAVLANALADHLLAQGLGAASLRPLAAAAGLSDRMLLYYFTDKADALGAALTVVATRMTALLAAQAGPQPLPFDLLLPRLRTVLLSDAAWPYMQLWLEIAALAARGDPLLRPLATPIAHGFLAWGRAQLDSPDPDTDALKLLTILEGSILLKGVGLAPD
ncbi:TetR/AcrR family transcriptional regulator [Sandaracinobacteroides saxicola]|uniref:TetR/AcrR family transcriptional regulator n=1 Tax=Sandaracinobacteroides saxicola TaxID=2759707 RepID=A0A7G5IKN9_9SPHN|nr:TetR/AcrR family transcriptional regulator [Sandaracinobacteroides saxicola]QMW23931.1 TetR/AcrR family transcriptional regulator [Sandaracinobacteroides saxicola]